MLMHSLTRRERGLLILFALLAGVALFGPSVPMPAAMQFADRHAWQGLPNAMDVLSNLPFLAIGFWGLRWVHWLERTLEDTQCAVHGTHPAAHGQQPAVHILDCAWMFFAGLMVTAVGSAVYHLQPDDLRLAADRAGMTVAFAGLIGIAVSERVSVRAGWPAAWVTLASGLGALFAGHETGDMLPWGLVQFGGMALVLALALIGRQPDSVGLKLGWVIFFYALAKVFELADQAIFDATHQIISGHTLKHLTAALAAIPVLHALQASSRRSLRHNPGAAAVTA